MKKILTLATVVLLFSGAAYACEGKSCCKDKSSKKECKKHDSKTKKETSTARKA